ncbi:hypothetical protein MLD52_22080 [Puniceicoccaceae bacterium K14]|nr:hypothetical protein [Puniceicoccaceae bacterium K14]
MTVEAAKIALATEISNVDDFLDAYQGSPISGSPSGTDFDRMRKCKAAGF